MITHFEESTVDPSLKRGRICDGALEAIGETPLIRLRDFLDTGTVPLYVKWEPSNPGGSAKDRPARQMIEEALRMGRIRCGSTVVESSSGNMGIGLAQACGRYGLRLLCVVDPNAQPQNVAIMRALGAEIELVTEPVEGDFLKARLERVATLLERVPGSFWTNQYANVQNPLSHTQGTVREIDEAFGGEVDYLFVATSSTGTARGCREYFDELGRRAQVVVVDALGSVLFGGAKGPRRIPGLGAGTQPSLARAQQFNEVRRVSDLDCVVGCRRMALRESMLVGGSGGGVLQTIRCMSSLLRGKLCVAIIHDSGTRYLDTVFSNDWVDRELGCSATELYRRVRESDATLFSRSA